MLTIGYTQQIITPDINQTVYLAGFGQNRVAQSVHDDLYLRALALANGDKQLVFITLDLIGLARHHCQAIEQRVQAHHPNTQVIIVCSHTHHGPDTIGLWGPDQQTSGVDTAYLDDLKTRIVNAALLTLTMEGKTTVQLQSASITVQGVAKNARDPEILDDELTILQFRTPENRVQATLLIFPCHPEVLWEHNPHITADYVHTLREAVEEATSAPALFMPGALGGMMTPDMPDHDFDSAAEMGRIIAQAGLDAITLTPGHETTIDCRRETFHIPLESPLLELAINAGLLGDVGRDIADGILTETNLIKLGRTWLITVPGELLPKLGLQLKADLRAAGAATAAVIGLANDEIGYILPEDDYIYPENPFEPGDHYEETMSPGKQTASILLKAISKTLM